MEKEENSMDDFFEGQETPKPRIHRKAGDEGVCTSCEG